MDSVTQAVLGGAVGEAVLGRKVGNKAVAWGVVAGTLPDLDALISSALSMETVDAFLFHRGASHSIALALVVSLVLGPLLRRLHSRDPAAWWEWALLVFLGMVTHALLDCFTTWGTELFWPFWDYRVEFGSIFVIDPLYTIPFLVFLVLLMFKPKESAERRKLNKLGLGISTAYLALTVVNKLFVGSVFESALEKKGIAYTSYTTAPLPFNNILWRVNAKTEDGYYIGYYSHFDGDRDIPFVFHPNNREALAPVRGIPKVEQLLGIAKNEFTVVAAPGQYRINDLRFGQTTGWKNPDAEFTFVYVVTPVGDDSVTVVQAPQRSSEVNGRLLQEFGARIFGREFLHFSIDTVSTGGQTR
jgi:inner membrane protein